jgi:predicted unusual protein kinase regulating ubiquinone biosynthesis (AarF/ABC1/UbiB family)
MSPTRETNIISRGYEIARVSAAYFLFYKINRHKHKPLGMRIRLACEELGLVFIKLGQILSTRYDLLEREDCAELQKLLDEVPPMGYEVVQNIFIHDFKKTPQELGLSKFSCWLFSRSKKPEEPQHENLIL